ncbi:hypothetical protein pdam_00008956 [Pocillopora damicornis]|uniref:Uncharacterized protein n=1 Tax=Pocillopora damicornis TaxID=46731 RepID=A0A3M6T7N8_POCDA|nr:hypothetical protein pdam_00008956 [Pocillopora damicornis]
MEVEDLEWYSPFVFFGGAILSFVDPITDILTVMEFNLAGHKTWFAAFARLEAFLFCLKKWWSGDEIDPFSSTEAEDVLYY